jgi:PPK2 family polyphosphate:nucleotide phosphotransferase
MKCRGRFVVEPGAQVHLDKIDANYSGVQGRQQSERKTRKTIAGLSKLQYLLFANGDRSLLIILQGPDASGKDGLIKHLFSGLNPQGVAVTDFKEPTQIEADHDFVWRVHRRAPAKGGIMVFNRSHYEDVLVARVHQLVPRSEWTARYALINSFEELLAHNGTRVLKFYLHISADEQLERFRRRLDDKARRWKISEADYYDRKLWDQFMDAHEDMLARTSTASAPWYVIPSNHKWFRNFAISQIVVATMKDFDLKIPPASVDIADIRRKYHAAKNGA